MLGQADCKGLLPARRFIIVAPDSSKPIIWGMRMANQPFSTDWEHVQASYRYVMSLPHVRKDRRHIVYAGALG